MTERQKLYEIYKICKHRWLSYMMWGQGSKWTMPDSKSDGG